MDTAPWAKNPEILFDPEQQESTQTLIAQPGSRYMRFAKRLLEDYTGDQDTFLTAIECNELAQIRLDGVIARETLDAASAQGKRMTKVRRDKLEAASEAGLTARTKLIETNLRFAAAMARDSMGYPHSFNDSDPARSRSVKNFKSRYASLDDRMQAANEGLIKAVDRFEPRIGRNGKPVHIMSLAWEYIYNALHDEVVVSEPNGLKMPSGTVNKIRASYKYPEDSTPETLRQHLLWDAGRHAVSLEAITTTSEAVEEYETDDESVQPLTVADVTPDIRQVGIERNMILSLAGMRLREALGTIPEREAGVLAMRWGIGVDQPMSLDEVGLVYGVTRERIRQIESRAESRMRHPVRTSRFRFFLGKDTSADSFYAGSHSQPNTDELGHAYGIPAAIDDWRYNLVLDNADESIQGVSRHNWNVSEDEDWDTPVRKTDDELQREHEDASDMLTNMLRWVNTKHFTYSQSDAEFGSFYPNELLEDIEEECGIFLQASHIESFWNEHLPSLIARGQKEWGDDFSLDRVSLLFSRLIGNFIKDNDSIALHIPDALSGQINMFGYGIGAGTIHVTGNLGDYAGYALDGVAHLVIEGDVGDYAGADMNDYAALEINGNAGQNVGYNAKNGSIKVRDYAETLNLRRNYKGDVVVGAVGSIDIASPRVEYATAKKST